MRAPSFVLAAIAALAALGAVLWLSRNDEPNGDVDPIDVVPREDDAENGTETPIVLDVGTSATVDDAGAADDPGRVVDPVHAAELVMEPFRGAALIQREGDRPTPVSVGTLSLEIWTRDSHEPIEASVLNGRFEAEVPSIARVLLVGGVFEGERVRFPGLERPFDPTVDDYALVGVPFPTNVLRVVDGGQRSPLTGVRIRRATDASAALLSGQVDEGALVVDDGVAPVVLPWIESKTPVWLRVSAPGYAAASVLVDPNVATDREVALWPSADLVVRVAGEGRANVRALVLFREEGENRSPVAAMLKPNDPGVRRDANHIVFDIEGLAGLPHRIVAKGYDGKGRAIDLAETHVVLGAGASREVTLRIGG